MGYSMLRTHWPNERYLIFALAAARSLAFECSFVVTATLRIPGKRQGTLVGVRLKGRPGKAQSILYVCGLRLNPTFEVGIIIIFCFFKTSVRINFSVEFGVNLSIPCIKQSSSAFPLNFKNRITNHYG